MQEGGSSEGKVPCALHQEFLFLVHEYLGLETARLGWSIGSYETWSTRKPCAKKVPETDYFTQRKQYLKKDYFTHVEDPAAKHCNKEGPHYRPGEKREESCHETCNKCHMAWVRWKSRRQVFVARKGRTIALERSVRQESCHLTSDNQPLLTNWISSGDSILGLYCAAWVTQESVSSRIFVRKKGMSHDPSNERSQQTLSAEGGKGKSTVLTLLLDSHECLAYKKPAAFCSRNVGVHVRCTGAKKTSK